MSEVVQHHQDDNNDDGNSSRGRNNNNNNNSQSDLTKYNYMCDDCGDAFYSLNEYIEHYKHYHPRSIGTAIT
jgi:hypothetical protein